MATREDQEVAETYRSILEEITVRIHSIDQALRTNLAMRALVLREFGFLQLRMCCELIALGCLICHGDIPATKAKALQKAYDPKSILSGLEGLTPHFYPVPFKPEFLPGSPGELKMHDYDQPYLTKSELIALWAKCGNALHKGNIRNFLRYDDKTKLRSDDILAHAQKVANLIVNHRISRKDNTVHLICGVNRLDASVSGEITYQINVATAEHQPPLSAPPSPADRRRPAKKR